MSEAILITGAGARLGKALALALGQAGHAVALHYNRSKDGAQAQADAINAEGGSAVIVQANLNVPQELSTLIARSAKALGRPITAAINNASTFTPDSVTDHSAASFDHHMNVNLRAPLSLAQQLAAQSDHGQIINIVDQRVLKPNPEFLTYSLSKSAIYWATKTLAQSMAPNFRVNAIGPGPTLQNIRQSEADFQNESNNTLLGIGSSPDDIVGGVLYLLGAKAVTGQMIAIDGGQHLTWKTVDFVGENG